MFVVDPSVLQNPEIQADVRHVIGAMNLKGLRDIEGNQFLGWLHADNTWVVVEPQTSLGAPMGAMAWVAGRVDGEGRGIRYPVSNFHEAVVAGLQIPSPHYGHAFDAEMVLDEVCENRQAANMRLAECIVSTVRRDANLDSQVEFAAPAYH